MAATNKTVPNFDDIIQEGRRKKKNEQLAQQIFRRGSTPGSRNTSRNQSPKPSQSLASRVGVQKRPQNPRQSSSQGSARLIQNARPKFTPHASVPTANNGPGISIKGMAGSCVVIAQNFAPGTTASDIESVMTPLGDGGVTSCRLISSQPTVIAELVFASREQAQTVVERFNNKKADGHLLYVYIKNGATPQAAPPTGPSGGARNHERRQPIPRAPRADHTYNDQSMEVDEVRDDGAYRDVQYDRAPPTQPRRAQPSFEDGRYGFGSNNNTDANSNNAQYDDRGHAESNRGRYDNRGQGRDTRYRQDRGRGGQGRLASDSILGRR